MKLFLTGATGFIGRAFLKYLLGALRNEDTVYLLVRSQITFEDPRIRLVHADLLDIVSARDALLECEYVFHLAANAAFGDRADYDSVNYLPTKELVDILKESRVLRCLIFTSTIGASDRADDDRCKAPLNTASVPSPRSGYGKSKLKAERCIQSSGLPFCIIRPSWVYGSAMRTGSHISRFVSMVQARHPATRLAFPGKVSLIHVDDLVVALFRCIDNRKVVGRTFFAETETLSIGSLFACIGRKLYGAAPTQVPVPSFSGVVSRLHARLPLTVANLFIDYLWASDPAFRESFGLERPVRFEEGIADVIATHPRLHGYWIITGANSGIGLALARSLYASGSPLVLIDRQTDKLDIFEGAVVLPADLSSESDIERVCAAVRGMRIRCLVNNAGIGLRGALRDTLPEEIKRIVAVNALAPVLLTRCLIEELVAHESVVINIASSIAYNPLPYMSLYSSTKAFISNWSESLTYELRATNRVITFSPSGTLTSFQQTAGVKLLNEGKGLLTPDFVALRIIEAEQRRKPVVILGWPTRILLLVSRLIPRGLNIVLWGKLFEKYR